MEIKGDITEFCDGGFLVYVPFPDIDLLIQRQITRVGVTFDDGRTISLDQRRKIFALIRDITTFISSPPYSKRRKEECEILRQMKLLYLADYADSEEVRYILTYHFCSITDRELFSLSDIDMTTAREFIDWLIELCIEHGVPCIDTLANRCEDIGRYLYACVANRRCCICGRRAEIHEVDHVGMGRNRRKIHHLGQRVQPLCRKHHCEVGQIGQPRFDAKYHLESVRLDEHLCDVLRWKK